MEEFSVKKSKKECPITKLDLESMFERGNRAIESNLDARRDDLQDRGITDFNEIENIIRKERAIARDELSKDIFGEKDTQDVNYETKEFLGFKDKEVVEIVPEVKKRLEDCGVVNMNLEGMKEEYQIQLADALEEMDEEYPELKGYITSIRVKELSHNVYACAGPILKENGFSGELCVSKELFSKWDLEKKISEMEQMNWRGEKWLAGKGADGVLKHEMAHILHLKLIADQEGIALGSNNKEDLAKVADLYYHNSVVSNICYESLKTLNISPKDIGKELSVYGSQDFGEFFAEAMAEYETQHNPRKLACEVHRRYEELISERGVAR